MILDECINTGSTLRSIVVQTLRKHRVWFCWWSTFNLKEVTGFVCLGSLRLRLRDASVTCYQLNLGYTVCPKFLLISHRLVIRRSSEMREKASEKRTPDHPYIQNFSGRPRHSSTQVLKSSAHEFLGGLEFEAFFFEA